MVVGWGFGVEFTTGTPIGAPYFRDGLEEFIEEPCSDKNVLATVVIGLVLLAVSMSSALCSGSNKLTE